jgi:hypothetical protein
MIVHELEILGDP